MPLFAPKTDKPQLQIQNLSLKPWRRKDLKTYLKLREVNLQHLQKWEASSPPSGSVSNSPTSEQADETAVNRKQIGELPTNNHRATELTAELKQGVTSYFKWMLKRNNAEEVQSWAIWLQKSSTVKRAEIIGEVMLAPLVHGAYSYSRLGYWLSSEHTAKGYATKACALAIHHCLQDMGINRIEALVQPENLPSRFLLERLNLRSEGLRKNCVFVQGKWQDHLVYAITADEFAQWKAQTYNKLLTIK